MKLNRRTALKALAVGGATVAGLKAAKASNGHPPNEKLVAMLTRCGFRPRSPYAVPAAHTP